MLISKKFDIPVYANKETWNAMPKQESKILDKNKKSFNPCDKFEIGELKIVPFEIPHDAAKPCGFNVFSGTRKLSIATDLGHITEEIMENLKHRCLCQ